MTSISIASLLTQMLETVAEALGPDLRQQLVFVGGCTTALFITDPITLKDVRATQDIDLIVDITGISDWHNLEQTLSERGFHPSPKDNLTCRKRLGPLTVDFMPDDARILGFTNRWYRQGIETSLTHHLPNGLEIRCLTPPLFIATKLEAYLGRGNHDLLGSKDIEDIFLLIDGRAELADEIRNANPDVRAYIAQQFAALENNRRELDMFIEGNIRGVQAMAKGTRCKQYLFSVSLNPPETENVAIEVFEGALASIEEKLGLQGQPRMVVFHEKEGRRHAHAVWSRIDAETMTAKQLSFFKSKLREVSKQLYLENGWKMPSGLMDSKARDPRNFTLDEWQQAKRAGLDAKSVKGIAQECWAVSDNAQTFAHALEERGLYLAKGDRRSHVAVTYEGEVFALSRLIGVKAKDVTARLGKADALRSVEETKAHIANAIAPRLDGFLQEAKRMARDALKPLVEKKKELRRAHAEERQRMAKGQRERWQRETKERASRLRTGVRGLWDRLTGDHAKMVKKNEFEAYHALRRDRDQRQAMLNAQHAERRKLQEQIKQTRERHARQILSLHNQAANYRLMRDGSQQTIRSEFSRSAGQAREQSRSVPTRGLELGR
ncbi:MAG: relaxase/mobilization nuclease domain-containing protein [Pseudobdellovibrionaceae bacterium]